jgi:hypothetical protein
MSQPNIAVAAILYFVLPLWLVAGFADWLCHRASRIEQTTGVKEALIHLLMFAEIGVGLLAGIFLDVNAGVFLLLLGVFFAHEATALWDVAYARTARELTPIEQHVHSFLELVPLMVLLILVIVHWPQFEALFGAGSEAARFGIHLKQPPLPRLYVATLFGAIVCFEFLPYLEELWRDWRTSGGRLVPAAAARKAVRIGQMTRAPDQDGQAQK